MPDRYRRQLERPSLPPIPTGWKVLFAFAALLGVGFLGLVVWAVITLVTHYT